MLNDYLLLAQIELPKEFITRTSALTFTGLVSITFIICSVVQRFSGKNPLWLGLIIPVGLCIYIATRLPNPDVLDYFLAVVNGCLVFLSAAGVTSAGNHLPGAGGGGGGGGGGPAPAMRGPAAPKRGFFTPWF